MKPGEVIQWSFGLSVNLIVTIFLIKTAWEGNDKGILLLIFFYPVLILIHLLIWSVLRVLKKSDARIYGAMAVCLAILFIPLLFMATLY